MSVSGQSEQQVCFDEVALEDWLRSRGGQPWFEGIVLECIERFPRLDRFQVTAVILKLRDEDSVVREAQQAKELIERFDVDFGSMPEGELTSFLRTHGETEREGT